MNDTGYNVATWFTAFSSVLFVFPAPVILWMKREFGGDNLFNNGVVG